MESVTMLYFLSLVIFIVGFSWQWQKKVSDIQLKYIKNYKFNGAILKCFHEKNPYLNSKDIKLVTQAMRDYFIITHNAKGKMVAMPSEVVDEFWHTFILFTKEYHIFCEQSFAKFLHHTPTEVMKSPTIAFDGMKLAWRLSCELEKIDFKSPLELPFLFAIDEILNVPNGRKYTLDCSHFNNYDNGTSMGYCVSDLSSDYGDSSDSGSSDDSNSSCGGSSCGGGCGGD